MTETLFMGLLTVFGLGWGSLWWRLGKLEGRVNGTLKSLKASQQEWTALKRLCPLCPKDEERRDAP